MTREVTDTRRIDGALSAGQFAQHPIFYFDLAPVLERAGSSLIRNAEGLEVLCRHGLGNLRETDITLFEGTGFYLIVGSCIGAQAEALANRVNVALLKLFFGTDSTAPEQLTTLFRPALPGEIANSESARLLQTAVQLAAPHKGIAHEPAGNHPQDGMVAVSRQLFADVARRGVFAPTQAMLCFVPVYDIKRCVPALFLCVPMAHRNNQTIYGRAAFGEIDAEQAPLLDEAILRYAVQFSGQLRDAGSGVAVTAPVSVETLGWSRGRSVYQKALQRAGLSEQPDIIPTIDDVSVGTRPIRIAEMIGAMRAYARRIAVSLPSAEAVPDGSGMIGAAGFIVGLPRRCDSEGAARTAHRLARLCATQSAFSCLTDVNSEDALDAAREANIRFCAGIALAPRALSGESAVEYAKLLLRMPPASVDATQSA